MRNRWPNFDSFVVWSTLIVGAWVGVGGGVGGVEQKTLFRKG